jgi:hypothetical protein
LSFLPPLLFLRKRERKLSPPWADPCCTPAQQSIQSQGTLHITSNSGHNGQHTHILAHPCTYEKKLENTSSIFISKRPLRQTCAPLLASPYYEIAPPSKWTWRALNHLIRKTSARDFHADTEGENPLATRNNG